MTPIRGAGDVALSAGLALYRRCPELYDTQRYVTLARQAVEFDSEARWNRYALGVVLFNAGRYDEARDELQLALELNRLDRASIQQFMAMTEWYLGNHASARDYRERALAQINRTAPKHTYLLWAQERVDRVLGIPN